MATPSEVNAEMQEYSLRIGSNIQKINRNVQVINKLVKQLQHGNGSVEQLRNQVYQLSSDTKGLVKDTKVTVRQFQVVTSPPRKDLTKWRVQAERLNANFLQVVDEFNSVQKEWEIAEKDALVQPLSDIDEETSIEPSEDLHAIKQHQTQSQVVHTDEELKEMHERQAQIDQLESDIVDVNTIFKDLSQMVYDQGDVLDSIEANTEVTVMQVEQANVQLKEAKRYMNKSRKKKVCIAIILLVVLGILIGLIVWSTSS